jgi:GH25 family lysozyme M1 (1,4-beta-N-acetylmuramidase)
VSRGRYRRVHGDHHVSTIRAGALRRTAIAVSGLAVSGLVACCLSLPAGVAQASPASAATASSTATTTLSGLDVSSAQHPTSTQYPNGAPINWADVAAAGYQFAAIKATEGNYYTNPYYASDAAAAIAAGMYVAAYQFANPNPKNGTAVQEADYAVQNAGNYKVGGQYLPLMLDLEYNPYPADGNECYGLSPAQMVSWVGAFVTEAAMLTGAAPIIYTPANWWDLCTGNSTAFGANVLWIPSYSASAPGTLPAGWNTWAIWQYTSAGSVPGISGSVDLDYFTGGQLGQTAEGTPVQIETLNALALQQVTYSVTGLPPGLTMNSGGLITGAPTSTGTYQATVTTSPASVLPATVSLTWDVTGSPAAGPPASAAGVEGTNGSLFVEAPQLGAGWHSEGGKIAGPPAVAATPNPDGSSPVSPFFIATGTNEQLYIRSLTTGWQPVGPVRGSCLGSPAAIIAGGQLVVACEGTNHALYYNAAAVPSVGLPQFTSPWTSLGGVLTAGPAVAPVGGALTFFVLGTTGRIYTRTLATGFAPTPWGCVGSPAAALQPSTGTTYFACQGTNHQLYEASSTGAAWTSAVSLGGTLAGGPAIAATSQQVEFLVEGTTHAVYQRTLTSGFTCLGGAVVNGAGGSALN